MVLLLGTVGRPVEVVGNKVVDPDCRVTVCRVDVGRTDEKVDNTAVMVSVVDDDAVCHETVAETVVVMPSVESGDRDVGEETGGEDDDDTGDDGVM